jgi:hypothetical protein
MSRRIWLSVPLVLLTLVFPIASGYAQATPPDQIYTALADLSPARAGLHLAISPAGLGHRPIIPTAVSAVLSPARVIYRWSPPVTASFLNITARPSTIVSPPITTP